MKEPSYEVQARLRGNIHWEVIHEGISETAAKSFANDFAYHHPGFAARVVKKSLEVIYRVDS